MRGTRVLHADECAAQALAMASRLGSFSRECGFYAALAAAPASTQSAAGEGGGASPGALPAAPAWFARHDPAGACLLFEDLSACGWSAGDQVDGASLDAARATLRAAAALHAAYWRHPQLPQWSGPAGWLPRLDAERFISFDSAEFAASWPRWRKRFPEAAAALPPAVASAFDAQPAAFSRAARRLLVDLAREPVTLLHGDLRFDNVFLRGGGGADTRARFIDMGGAHIACFACGACDAGTAVLTRLPRCTGQTARLVAPCLTSLTFCQCRSTRRCAGSTRRRC